MSSPPTITDSPGNTRPSDLDLSTYHIAQMQAQLGIHQTEALASDLELEQINVVMLRKINILRNFGNSKEIS